MEKHDRIQSTGFDELKIYPKLDNSYNENNNEKFCGVDPDLIGFNIMLSQELYWVAVPTSNVECSLLPNNQFYKICSQLYTSLFCYEISNRM